MAERRDSIIITNCENGFIIRTTTEREQFGDRSKDYIAKNNDEVIQIVKQEIEKLTNKK